MTGYYLQDTENVKTITRLQYELEIVRWMFAFVMELEQKDLHFLLEKLKIDHKTYIIILL